MPSRDIRDVLATVDARAADDRSSDQSLWALIQSIHAAPALRDFVTLGSRGLCPYVVRPEGAGDVRIHLLLSADAQDGWLHAPWGYVAWNWPSRRLVAMQDIREAMAGFGPLPPDCACTREYAAAVEAALQRHDRPLPQAPAPIPDLVRRAFGAGTRPGPVAAHAAPQPPVPAPAPAAARPVASGVGRSAGLGTQAHVAARPTGNRLDDLMPCLEAAGVLLAHAGSPALQEEWQRIHARIASPRFSVAVVGERSRGKSTLINRLLGADILPVTSVPGPAQVLEVYNAAEPVLERAPRTGAHWVRQPVTLPELHSLLSEGRQTPGPRWKLGWPHPWLEAQGVRLIEIPCGGDVGDIDTATVLDAVAVCDAALMVVSATMAMALTEKRFVEEYLLARHIPHIALVITHLDGLGPQDATAVLDFLGSKVQAWGVDMPICAATDLSERALRVDGVPPGGAASILARLAAWASDPEQRLLVHRQVTANLLALLSRVRGALDVRRQTAAAARDEGLRRLSDARQQAETLKLNWGDALIGLEQRRLGTHAWLVSEMQDRAQSLVEALRYEARRTENARTWWQRDLPYRLKREFASARLSLEQPLERRILADANWLVSEVERRFAYRIEQPRYEEIVNIEVPRSLETCSLVDTHKLRWLLRGGGLLVASGAAYCLLPLGLPLGLLFSGGPVLFSELVLHKTIEQQREVLASNVADTVESVMAQALAPARQRLDTAYEALAASVEQQAEAWWRAQEQALATARPDGSDIAEIERHMADVDRLTNELAAEVLR